MSDRLDSWKDIASYLGRDVRTAQRWSSDRGLPVHRVPGGPKARVFALRSELDAWLQTSSAEPAQAPSVAVLPFANLSGDKTNEYFSDGLADEIINALTRVPGLRVTARTSSFAFRGKEQDVREIGVRLGAAALLEGSVRREGNRVRVSAQLVSAGNGYHLWSECYDRELAGIFAIQDEIARAIALALRVRLAPDPLVGRSTEDLEAYNLWLKGRCAGRHYTPDAMAQARDCFAAALARDPQFAMPYLSMADLLFHAANFWFVQPAEAAAKAKQAVLKALALDDALGEAHALLGAVRSVFEYDWAGAGSAFERALELSPGAASTLRCHAWYFLTPRLRITEALAAVRQAVILDPLSSETHSVLGLVLTAARNYRGAEEECRLAVDLAPGLWMPHWFLGWALIFQGQAEEGLLHCRFVACGRGPREPSALAGMCLVSGWVGRTADAERLLSELEEVARTAWVPPLAFAWCYLGLNDERVFEWLDKAIDARDPLVTHMSYMPIYDGIRADLRFQRLLDKMGLA